MQLSRHQKDKIARFEARQLDELIYIFLRDMTRDEATSNDQYIIRKSAELSRRMKQSELDKVKHAKKMLTNEANDSWREQEKDRRAA